VISESRATPEPRASTASVCPGCGTEVAPAAVACPRCNRLIHGDRLRCLAAEADQATRAGDHALAIEHWRSALELLPSSSKQHAQIAQRIAELTPDSKRSTPAPKDGVSIATKLAGLGALAMLVWKLKSILLFVATKAKLLLLGFTKAGTLLSMFASIGLYATLWGWKFALGLTLSIYVHEIGHVAALRKLGIAATAPMFIPGLGAFVRLKQYPASASEDAEVGLAGPLWGLAASAAAWLGGTVFEADLLLAIARVGAWINLFNLLPIGPLDGGRGFRALTKRQRFLACAALAAGLLLSGDGILLLLLAVAAFRAIGEPGAAEPNRRALVKYAVLVVGLALLCGSASAK
jgi:Zn-dependent protease